MSRCKDCRKEYKELRSTWDKIRLFIFSFFQEDIADIRQDYYTKGYGEGYGAGFERAKKAQVEVITKYKL